MFSPRFDRVPGRIYPKDPIAENEAGALGAAKTEVAVHPASRRISLVPVTPSAASLIPPAAAPAPGPEN